MKTIKIICIATLLLSIIAVIVSFTGNQILAYKTVVEPFMSIEVVNTLGIFGSLGLLISGLVLLVVLMIDDY